MDQRIETCGEQRPPLCGDSMLTEVIANAVRVSLTRLFSNGETFFHCSLVVTGDGLHPRVAAWSWEALERESAIKGSSEKYCKKLKISLRDSPYFSYGQEHFCHANRLLLERPARSQLSREAWGLELGLRLQSMEDAISRLDEEGLFGVNQPRAKVTVLVEIMGP